LTPTRDRRANPGRNNSDLFRPASTIPPASPPHSSPTTPQPADPCPHTPHSALRHPSAFRAHSPSTSFNVNGREGRRESRTTQQSDAVAKPAPKRLSQRGIRIRLDIIHIVRKSDLRAQVTAMTMVANENALKPVCGDLRVASVIVGPVAGLRLPCIACHQNWGHDWQAE